MKFFRSCSFLYVNVSHKYNVEPSSCGGCVLFLANIHVNFRTIENSINI